MSSNKAEITGPSALLVGISTYPYPIRTLPAVAGDVREMGNVLSSGNGIFVDSPLRVLSDEAATKRTVETALKATLQNASEVDSVFVYLAGHGAIVDHNYYFVPVDADVNDLGATCIKLTRIKRLFDRSRSRRILMWLDFCHSGGMLDAAHSMLLDARTLEEDSSVIRRDIKVVNGHGKILIAACTPSQYAYESGRTGHGLFTGALLRGLRGEANSHGEVTAASLYEFIDREVSTEQQQPVFFGVMRGRLVLIHSDAMFSSEGPSATKKAIGPVLPTLLIRSGDDLSSRFPDYLRQYPALASTSFTWLDRSDTQRRFVVTPFPNGIDVEAYPHLICSDASASASKTRIPYGSASSAFHYCPRGRFYNPTFRLYASHNSAEKSASLGLRDCQTGFELHLKFNLGI